MSKAPNIVLITVDCLRADVLGCYGGPAKTPNLDKISGRGARFAYAFAHGHFTKTTFPSIFSGTYPADHGGTKAFAARRPSFVVLLKESGYHTVGVNSNPWLSSSFGFDRGFEEYLDISSATPTAHSIAVRTVNNLLGLVGGGFVFPPYPPGELVTERALQLLAGVRQPFFMWVHYMDAHWPYAVSKPRLFGPWDEARWPYNARLARKSRREPLTVDRREREGLRGLYLEGVREADRQIGRLLGVLGDDDIVLVTSDHGEAFGEHGIFFHQPSLFTENTRVPLLLLAPSVKPRVVVHDIVRHLDLAPTIVAAVSGTRSGEFEGVNLAALASEDVEAPSLTAFAEATRKGNRLLSVRNGSLFYLLELSADAGRTVEELYDFRKDPRERKDLRHLAPARIEHMRTLAKGYLDRFPGGLRDVGAPLARSDVGSDLAHRLEALGYLE